MGDLAAICARRSTLVDHGGEMFVSGTVSMWHAAAFSQLTQQIYRSLCYGGDSSVTIFGLMYVV